MIERQGAAINCSALLEDFIFDQVGCPNSFGSTVPLPSDWCSEWISLRKYLGAYFAGWMGLFQELLSITFLGICV